MSLFVRERAETGPRRGRRRPSGVLRVEPLEGRSLPSVITVLNTDNAGPDSLRDAIERANALPGPDTITFAPAVAGTITLTDALPVLLTDIDIEGPGASVLTVARSAEPSTALFQIFFVPRDATVAISGLTITGGDLRGTRQSPHGIAPS